MHCAVLAPQHTRVIECTGAEEEIPNYNEEETVLLFPSEVLSLFIFIIFLFSFSSELLPFQFSFAQRRLS